MAPRTADLLVHAAAPPSDETTLFIVQPDGGGLAIRLIMSHRHVDGCLSVLVFTKELVTLPLVAVDTGASC